MTIPAARSAVDKGKKVKNLSAWSNHLLTANTDVVREPRSRNVPVHFVSSLDLCHLKHSELAEHLQHSKGREGLRGDNVENDMGFETVSSKGGASASRATAATISDTRSGVPGMDGEGNYAVSVYIQLRETVAPRVLEL